jgi:hypothetical protein
MGWVDVFSSGLIVDECLSKNDIRSRPLLGGVLFSIYIRCYAYILPLYFVASHLQIFIRLVQRFDYH